MAAVKGYYAFLGFVWATMGIVELFHALDTQYLLAGLLVAFGGLLVGEAGRH